MDGEQQLGDAERELADAREEGDVRLARALNRRAKALRRVGRTSDALADLSEVASRFPAGDDLRLREQLVWSLWLRMSWSGRPRSWARRFLSGRESRPTAPA